MPAIGQLARPAVADLLPLELRHHSFLAGGAGGGASCSATAECPFPRIRFAPLSWSTCSRSTRQWIPHPGEIEAGEVGVLARGELRSSAVLALDETRGQG